MRNPNGQTLQTHRYCRQSYRRYHDPDRHSIGFQRGYGSDTRIAAFDRGGPRSWTIEPGARTGIHHHGKQETVADVLKGQCRVRWGERGEFDATACAGDFIHVPSWVPHMEINGSNSVPLLWVVVRSTPTPIVVNLPHDYWIQN